MRPVEHTVRPTYEDLYWEARYRAGLHVRAVERENILREKNRELAGELRRKDSTIATLHEKIEALEAKLVWFQRQLFGQKTEKAKAFQNRKNAGDQDPGAAENSGCVPETEIEKRKRGKQPGAEGHGRKLRSNLPAEEVVHDLPEDQRCCPICNLPRKPGPIEESEEVHWEVRLCRRIHKRKSYVRACSCKNVPRIVIAPPAPKLIAKGMFSCGFWTEVVLQKYLHAMPLNRIISMLEMKGLTVSAGTLCGGLQKIEPLLRPLYQRLVAHCRSARHWHMDETRWMVFAELEGKKGYRWWLWVVLSDEACVYILDPSRSAVVPKNFLGEDAEGHLSVDRYSAYKTLNESIKLAWCWAHVRRDFIDIGKSHKKLLRWSEQWVERIGELYQMNKQRVRNTPGCEQFMFFDSALREALEKMERKRDKELARPALHKAKKKALTSMRKHWKGLLVFADRPEIPMDNNPAERALRGGVLGRKNYYGSGSIQSGMLSVMLFSIIQTALRNNVNPERYLLNYFEACAHNNGQPPSNLQEFDPWNLPTERKTQWRMKQPRGDTADGISHPRKWNESGDSSPPVPRSIACNSPAGSVRNSNGAVPMAG